MKTSNYLLCSITIVSINILQQGCVTTHHGEPLPTKKGGLLLSCGRDATLSAGNYETISCSLENTDSTWKTVKVYKVLNKSGANVLSPTDVNDYLANLKSNLNDEYHNRDVALAGIALGGLALAVAGAATGNADLAGVGFGAAAGAGIAGNVRDMASARDRLQYGQTFVYGPDHILNNDIKIAAGLYVRKRILFELSEKRESLKSLTLCFDDEEKDCQDVGVKRT
ncbi:MAG: hypothetical protein AB7T49_10115 [Oligoflexales bacterium]